MVLDTKVTTSKESKMGKAGSFDPMESSWVDSSSRIGDKESAITWSRRPMRACSASSQMMTSMAWFSHFHMAKSRLNTLITESSRKVDLMVLECSNMKTAQSMRARLRMGKRTELDFRETH